MPSPRPLNPEGPHAPNFSVSQLPVNPGGPPALQGRARDHPLGFSDPDLETAILAATKYAKADARAQSKEAAAGFTRWISRQAKKGLKQVHDLTREQAKGLNHAGPHEFMWYATPDDMLQSRAEPWYERWSRDKHQKSNGTLAEAFTRLKHRAKQEEALPELNGTKVRNTLSLIKSGRAVSLDAHKCGDLKELPIEAFEDLAKIFNSIALEGSWPIEHSAVPISLIPKPDGGDRPIGVTPLLGALFLKSHSDVITEWEDSRMTFWEDAVKGSSALQAGLRRRLQDECTVALGQQ